MTINKPIANHDWEYQLMQALSDKAHDGNNSLQPSMPKNRTNFFDNLITSFPSTSLISDIKT